MIFTRIEMYLDLDLRLIKKTIELVYGSNCCQELKERRSYDYLKRYVIKDKSFNVRDIKVRDDIEETNAWICWLQGYENAPTIVKKCINSVEKNYEHQVILLDENNIKSYIKLPDYINQKWKKGVIPNAHYTDIVRVALLACYGGCWIDSTVFCMDKLPDYIFEDDLFCFNISDYGSHYKVAANWFIYSKKYNKLILKTLESLLLYWKKENKVIDYFLFHKIFKIILENDEEMRVKWNQKKYIETSCTHLLQKYLNNKFDEKICESIKCSSVIQKLTYKGKYIMEDSFYSKIILEN